MNAGNGKDSWGRADGLLRSYAETGDVRRRNEAVECCLSLAWTAAWKCRRENRSVRLAEDDAVGYATVGLVRAADSYAKEGQWSRPFKRYALTAAIRAVVRAEIENGGMVRVPEGLAMKSTAEELGALAPPVRTDGGYRLSFVAAEDGPEPSPPPSLESIGLHLLTAKESDAVLSFHGVGGRTETLAEIGDREGVTRTGVRHRYESGMAKLRKHAEQLGETP